MTKTDRWIEWPDKTGFYWFYGYLDNAEAAKKRGEKPKLQPVTASQGSKALVVHYWGDFMYRGHAAGAFLPLKPPFDDDESQADIDLAIDIATKTYVDLTRKLEDLEKTIAEKKAAKREGKNGISTS